MIQYRYIGLILVLEILILLVFPSRYNYVVLEGEEINPSNHLVRSDKEVDYGNWGAPES